MVQEERDRVLQRSSAPPTKEPKNQVAAGVSGDAATVAAKAQSKGPKADGKTKAPTETRPKATAKPKAKAATTSSTRQRASSDAATAAAPTCTYCSKIGHDAERCWFNPPSAGFGGPRHAGRTNAAIGSATTSANGPRHSARSAGSAFTGATAPGGAEKLAAAFLASLASQLENSPTHRRAAASLHCASAGILLDSGASCQLISEKDIEPGTQCSVEGPASTLQTIAG